MSQNLPVYDDLVYKSISLGDDGANGGVMVYSKPREQELYIYGVEIPYSWWLAGSAGAGFLLTPGPTVTSEEVLEAKACLRRERDVVYFQVERRAA